MSSLPSISSKFVAIHNDTMTPRHIMKKLNVRSSLCLLGAILLKQASTMMVDGAFAFRALPDSTIARAFHPSPCSSGFQLHLSSSPSEPSWIERSTPTGIDPSSDDGPAEYAIGISGPSFSTGPLSRRVYETLASVAAKRFPSGSIPDDLINVYKIYAMDMTAKEAVGAALRQNGMEMTAANATEGEWGDVEDVKLDLSSKNAIYGSFEEAVTMGEWEPGVDFSFVVRNVLAEKKEPSIEEILAALDPDGKIRKELNEREMMPDDPAARIRNLKDLAEDNERRCNNAPVTAVEVGFAGGTTRSYRPIPLSSLSSSPVPLMDAMESHSYVIIHLDDDDDTPSILHSLWKETERFFSTANVTSAAPPMETIPDAGSRHAVVGYASYDNDVMKFLETRWLRSQTKEDDNHDDNVLLPRGLLKDENAMKNAFRRLADIGVTIVEMAVAASSREALAETTKSASSLVDSSTTIIDESARHLARDLVDDGSYRTSSDTPVCTSPHRLCQYTHNSQSSALDAKEIFGAHTDTSFVTIVPVAETSGLEVFDETTERWIRPELIARRDWEARRYEKGLDLAQDDGEIPWYCSYVVIMPGEFMQVVTRGMILSAVHRVVAAKSNSRLSAPLLLRARSNAVMDINKYFRVVDDDNDDDEEDNNVGHLLRDCDGLTMEELHDRLQPSYRETDDK